MYVVRAITADHRILFAVTDEFGDFSWVSPVRGTFVVNRSDADKLLTEMEKYFGGQLYSIEVVPYSPGSGNSVDGW